MSSLPLPNFETGMTSGGDRELSNAHTSPAPSYPLVSGNDFILDGNSAFDCSLSSNEPLDHTSTQSHHQLNVPQADNGVTGADKPKFFACPWFKVDPLKHTQCYKFELKRPCDVKQHLGRNHQLKKHYCPRCRRQWPTDADNSEQLWSAHVSPLTCEAKSFQETGMLLPEEFESLNPHSKLGHREKWENMWKKCLPLLPLPMSPYRGDIVNETGEFFFHYLITFRLPQSLANAFMVKEGHPRSQEYIAALMLYIRQDLLGNVPNTASIAGPQPPTLSQWDGPMDSMSGATGSLPYGHDWDYPSQPYGQHQPTRCSPQYQQSSLGANVQGGGYLSSDQPQISQSIPLDPMMSGMDQGLGGPTSSNVAFPNSPNHHQQSFSEFAQVPKFPPNASNTPYLGRDAAMPPNFTHNLTTQPGHGHNLFSPGQQHPNQK